MKSDSSQTEPSASKKVKRGDGRKGKLSAPRDVSRSATAADETFLRQLMNTYKEATLRCDAKMVESIVADDYLGISPNGELREKSQTVEELKHLSYESIEYDDIEQRLYGHVAVITGQSTVVGRHKGCDCSGHYRFTRVFIKRDGNWRLVVNHGMQIINR